MKETIFGRKIIRNFKKYIRNFHYEELKNDFIPHANSGEVKILNIDTIKLLNWEKDKEDYFVKYIFEYAMEMLPILTNTVIEVQKKISGKNEVNENFNIRFINLPSSEVFSEKSMNEVESFNKEQDLSDHYINNIMKLHRVDYGKLIIVHCSVVSVSQSYLISMKQVFRCKKCKETFRMEPDIQINYILDENYKCKGKKNCRGRSFEKVSEACEEQIQEITIKEKTSRDERVHDIQKRMKVILTGDLVGKCVPGDIVKIIGTFCTRSKYSLKETKRFNIEYVILANNVSKKFLKEKKRSTREMGNFLKVYWEKFAKSPLYGRNLIVSSICPGILGMEYVKLLLLLTLIGGNAEDGGRKDLHLLLAGDPGLGKSIFLHFASKLKEKNVYVSGSCTTVAGITSAVVGNILHPGALVLADKGICCIDELDSFSKELSQSLLNAMESQQISVSKGGYFSTLQTRCSIIAACNPKEGEYNDLLSLSKNLPFFISPLLSRFDVILGLKDENDEVIDGKLANYILGVKKEERECFLSTQTKVIPKEAKWLIKDLKELIIFCRNYLNPKLPKNVRDIIKRYFNIKRDKVGEDESFRTSIRMLHTIRKLAQAHAKLMFRKQVRIVDVVIAISLFELTFGRSKSLFKNDLVKKQFDEDIDLKIIGMKKEIVEALGMYYDDPNDKKEEEEEEEEEEKEDVVIKIENDEEFTNNDDNPIIISQTSIYSSQISNFKKTSPFKIENSNFFNNNRTTQNNNNVINLIDDNDDEEDNNIDIKKENLNNSSNNNSNNFNPFFINQKIKIENEENISRKFSPPPILSSSQFENVSSNNSNINNKNNNNRMNKKDEKKNIERNKFSPPPISSRSQFENVSNKNNNNNNNNNNNLFLFNNNRMKKKNIGNKFSPPSILSSSQYNNKNNNQFNFEPIKIKVEKNSQNYAPPKKQNQIYNNNNYNPFFFNKKIKNENNKNNNNNFQNFSTFNFINNKNNVQKNIQVDNNNNNTKVKIEKVSQENTQIKIENNNNDNNATIYPSQFNNNNQIKIKIEKNIQEITSKPSSIISEKKIEKDNQKKFQYSDSDDGSDDSDDSDSEDESDDDEEEWVNPSQIIPSQIVNNQAKYNINEKKEKMVKVKKKEKVKKEEEEEEEKSESDDEIIIRKKKKKKKKKKIIFDSDNDENDDDKKNQKKRKRETEFPNLSKQPKKKKIKTNEESKII